MTLTIREQSDRVKAAAARNLPAEVVEAFDRDVSGFRDEGVPPGVVVPGDHLEAFTLEDATGTPVALDDLVADGPVVVVFYRGGWCPYCNVALRAYQQELLPQLPTFGARLVAISPQAPDESLTTTQKADLEFTVLSDPGARVARRLGIAFTQSAAVLAAQRAIGVDLVDANAEGSTWLPRPTVLVVDRDRTIRFADVRPDFTARTEVADIVEALGALGSGRRDGNRVGRDQRRHGDVRPGEPVEVQVHQLGVLDLGVADIEDGTVGHG